MPRPVLIYDSQERLRIRLPQSGREFFIDEKIQGMSSEVVVLLMWILNDLASSTSLQEMRSRLQAILADVSTEVIQK